LIERMVCLISTGVQREESGSVRVLLTITMIRRRELKGLEMDRLGWYWLLVMTPSYIKTPVGVAMRSIAIH